MKKRILFLGLTCLTFGLFAQKEKSPNSDYEAEQIVKEAAGKILNYCGLPNDFYIVRKDIPNVIAYSRQNKRYIGYNPAFIQRLRIETLTDWSAYSVLAHEIGHHLAGHTEDNSRNNPARELEADHFSGFILQHMGATLEEAASALNSLEQIDGIHDTIYHPPVQSRIESVREGWRQAAKLQNTNAITKEKITMNLPTMVYRCAFYGDENEYYIDTQDNIIWINNAGNPLKIGRKQASKVNAYLWIYQYGNNLYGVDNKGNIWNETIYGSKFKVGRVEELISK
ncbi:MAG: hypothetical protein KDC83_06950 [Flavobacteriales bacterium]|nr:hypothetical protein [Flavobacteriales bacterium]